MDEKIDENKKKKYTKSRRTKFIKKDYQTADEAWSYHFIVETNSKCFIMISKFNAFAWYLTLNEIQPVFLPNI